MSSASGGRSAAPVRRTYGRATRPPSDDVRIPRCPGRLFLDAEPPRQRILAGMGGAVATSRFVGREAELGRLEAAFRAVDGGEPAAVCLGGEAGVGKTRLVSRFADRVRERGGTVLIGGCVELGEASLPYAPVVEALRGLGRGLGPATLDELVGPGRPLLARLLPELGQGEESAERPGRPVGAGPAVRGVPRPAGAPRPTRSPHRAGGGGPALGGPLDPGPARLPRPQPAGRTAARADVPHRRAAPAASAAAVPGRAGPQRTRPAAGPRPLRPGRRRRPAGWHPRDAGRTTSSSSGSSSARRATRSSRRSCSRSPTTATGAACPRAWRTSC